MAGPPATTAVPPCAPWRKLPATPEVVDGCCRPFPDFASVVPGRFQAKCEKSMGPSRLMGLQNHSLYRTTAGGDCGGRSGLPGIISTRKRSARTPPLLSSNLYLNDLIPLPAERMAKPCVEGNAPACLLPIHLQPPGHRLNRPRPAHSLPRRSPALSPAPACQL